MAIVTGGATGIGRAISEGLAADGLAVVVGYFGNEAGAAETAAAIEETGGEVRLVRGDAGDPAAATALVEAAVASFGRLDVLCGHAGLTLFRRFLEMDPDAFDGLVATNLRGTYFAAQAAARRMVEQGEGGRIVLTSSRPRPPRPPPSRPPPDRSRASTRASCRLEPGLRSGRAGSQAAGLAYSSSVEPE